MSGIPLLIFNHVIRCINNVQSDGEKSLSIHGFYAPILYNIVVVNHRRQDRSILVTINYCHLGFLALCFFLAIFSKGERVDHDFMGNYH